MQAARVALLVFIVAALLLPAAEAATWSTGIYFRPDTATQGWYSFGSTLTWSTFTRDSVNKIDKYTNVKMSDAQWSYLGFASDTPSRNMTITSIENYKLTYTITGAGTQRIYAPNLSAPISVTGGSGSYNSATNILTLTTYGSGTVTVTWEIVQQRVDNAGLTLSSLLPLMAVMLIIGVMKTGKGTVPLSTVLLIIVFTAVLSAVLRLLGM